MKTKLLLTLLVAFLSFSNSYASFPVKRSIQTVQNSEITTSTQDLEEEVISPITTAAEKNIVVGGLLWFFLGGFAAHRWYYKRDVLANILFIITLGGLGVWWIIDAVNMFSGKWD